MFVFEPFIHLQRNENPKTHAYFNGIDWDQIESGELKGPFGVKESKEPSNVNYYLKRRQSKLTWPVNKDPSAGKSQEWEAFKFVSAQLA